MELLVNAVEFIAISARIREIDLGSTVTIDTPAHAQLGELLHFVHFRDGPVAGLALYFTGAGMLCVAEENVVRQIMDLYPFHRLAGLGIFSSLGVVAGIAV